MQTVPKLDLAPQLNRPLSLWNPFDYLRLLYWAFFFPQAIRWYVERFGTEQYAGDGWRALHAVLRRDPTQRNLMLQGFILMLGVPVIGGVLVQALGLPWSWFNVAVSVAGGVAGGMVVGVVRGAAVGAAGGVAVSVAVSVAGGVAGGVTVGMAVSMVVGVVVGAAGGVTVGMVVGMVVGAAGGVASCISIIRPLDYLLLLPFIKRVWRTGNGRWLWSRASWLPLPHLQAQLQTWATLDWHQTVENANALLAYTLQFIPVVHAINYALHQMAAHQLLSAVNLLCARPFDWTLIYYNSTSPRAVMWIAARESISRRQKTRGSRTSRLSQSLRQDSAPRAACGGFWLLHGSAIIECHTEAQTMLQDAVRFFTVTRGLPHGEEFYHITHLLNMAERCEDWQGIARWADTAQWLAPPPAAPLRPDALKTLSRLRAVALEAAVADESLSKLNRSAALNRALGELTRLLGDVAQTCPHPEREIVARIATRWRDLLGFAAGDIGQIVVTQAIDNPYVIGNPVVGAQFKGREDIMQRLEELWGGTGPRPSVVLYGHRRMGKSSILQNLGRCCFGANTLVTDCNMQRVGRVAHTGELLYDIAVALWQATSPIQLPSSPWPKPGLDDFNQSWYASFNRFMRALDARRNGRRIILTIDEFEIIEQLINDGLVERELLAYLRGLMQTEHWLILALAGLHTLKEMASDYFEPFYASVVPVQVSFLSEAALGQVIANPADDFPLDYVPDALDLIYRLTHGQPYLAQLIGHNLVSAFNVERFERNAQRDLRFTAADVEAVVTSPDFYEQGSYYFRGLWSQAEQSSPAYQTDVLRMLAPHVEGLTVAELRRETRLEESTVHGALATLEQHDVVQQDGETWQYRVELMRRWVMHSMSSSHRATEHTDVN